MTGKLTAKPVMLRLDPALYAQLEREARARRMGVSTYARSLLAELLTRNDEVLLFGDRLVGHSVADEPAAEGGTYRRERRVTDRSLPRSTHTLRGVRNGHDKAPQAQGQPLDA